MKQLEATTSDSSIKAHEIIDRYYTKKHYWWLWYTYRWVTKYYPYKLRFLHELHVMRYFYCTSYELTFECELLVTVYCTSHE